ncbi:MAG: sigma-54 dependent transcriptional regulator [Calditrichaceae bacterium]
MEKSDFKILIVDKDAETRDILKKLFVYEQYRVFECENAENAIEIYTKKEINLVISDIHLPGSNGLDLLRDLKLISAASRVIILTGSRSFEDAVDALKLGAEDYITKPINQAEILRVTARIFKSFKLKNKNDEILMEQSEQSNIQIVGNSAKMRKIFSDMKLVADSDIPVFIMGESGTGKDLVARAIHDYSPRKNEPFVVINCAAIPADLLESELFGHERGAFSGALTKKEGLFEVADNGTLLLDEIGELPLPMQGKLLRAVETMCFRRIGSTKEIHVNVRVICCTNRNIKQEIDEGRFRSDLFYRLSTFTFNLPPLRQRRSDIPAIIHHILKNKEKSGLKISTEIMETLENYDWPGNIRELEHVVERLIILSTKKSPTPDMLPTELKESYRRFVYNEPGEDNTKISPLKDIEEEHIRKILNHCHGNKREAARILGIGLKTLYRKLETYNQYV